MSNKEITLEVKPRNTGKHIARKLRREQWAPAVIYGNKKDTTPLALEQKYLDKYKSILNDNPIFVFKSEDKELNGQKAIIKDIVFHPLNRRATHVDFYAFAADQVMTVEVQIELTGTPKGVKEGGVLSMPHKTLTIECLPGNIPSKITHDISELGMDESLHSSELTIPEGVKVLNTDITIATIAEVREEIVEEEETLDVEVLAGAVPAEGKATAAAPTAEGENKEKKEKKEKKE